MKLPKISVVMPSYNQARYLERSLRSVLDQNYPRLEFIVVDGQSTDGSVEIIQSYASKLAWWTSEPDNGQADAINKGFRRATGDIVCWLNSDDLYCLNTLSFVGQRLADRPDVDVLYGGTVMVDDQDQIIDAVWPTAPDPDYLFYVGFDISQQSIFWRRSCFDEIGMLDGNLQYSMDYDFLLRLMARYRADWTSRFLGVFRRHSAAKSSTMLATSHRENAEVRRRYQRQFEFRPTRHSSPLACRSRRLARLVGSGAWRYLAFKSLKRIGISLPASFWLAQHPNALAIEQLAEHQSVPVDAITTVGNTRQPTATMRVAIVANYPSHYCVDLFNRLAERPEILLKVFYLRRQTPGREWNETRVITHDHVFVSEWRIHRTFYLNPGLARQVLRFRPDRLIITQYASVGMQFLMYLFSLLRKPWIFWSEAPGVRFSEMPALKTESLRPLARRLALIPIRRWPRQIWGVGSSTTADYRRQCRAQCANVPYYFDQRPFRAIHRGAREPGPVRFLFSGKLVHRKGFDLLLDALRQVVQRRSDFLLTILGSGPEAQLVTGLPDDLRGKMEMVGFREVRDLPAIYAQCDVLVFPTRYDGWGLAVIEAMAAGMPVVATRASVAAVDAIEPGVNGWLCEPESTSSLAEAVLEVLDSQDRLVAMGQAARRTAESFDVSVGAARVTALLTNESVVLD